MDVVERLSLEQAGARTLLALTHVHRYEVAAELCAGMRVLDLCCGSGYGARILSRAAGSVTAIDIDEASIARARAEIEDGDRIAFERSDALEYLERPLTEDFDAIVLLEGLEHLADLDRALTALHVHAEAGLMLIISLPNSRAFGEVNPHHTAEFDFETAMSAFERLGDALVLFQFNAEGSMIRAAEAAAVEGRTELAERGEPESANHFIALINSERSPARERSSTRMQLSSAPTLNSYMLELERANRTLWRTNQRLARERLGVADSAAATRIRRDAERGRAPRWVEPISAAVASAARFLATVVLNVLPHGLTLIALRARQRLRGERDLEHGQ